MSPRGSTKVPALRSTLQGTGEFNPSCQGPRWHYCPQQSMPWESLLHVCTALQYLMEGVKSPFTQSYPNTMKMLSITLNTMIGSTVVFNPRKSFPKHLYCIPKQRLKGQVQTEESVWGKVSHISWGVNDATPTVLQDRQLARIFNRFI